MNPDQPLYLHVGARKAGSTFLQENLFLAHPEINSLGKPYTDPDIIAFVTHLFEEEVSYNPDLAAYQVKTAVLPHFASAKINLLSSEDFSVPPNMRENIIADRGLLMRRFKDLFGQIRIVLVLRNQMAVLRSVYSDYLKDSFHRQYTYMSFNDWITRGLKRKTVQIHMYQYAPLLDFYATLVGRENICVLLHESLTKDGAMFAQDLAKFMEITPDPFIDAITAKQTGPRSNSRLGRAQLIGVRLGHFLGGRDVRALVPAPVKKLLRKALDGNTADTYALDETNTQALHTLYKTGNRQLTEEWGLPLAKYDYPL